MCYYYFLSHILEYFDLPTRGCKCSKNFTNPKESVNAFSVTVHFILSYVAMTWRDSESEEGRLNITRIKPANNFVHFCLRDIT